MRLKAPGSAPDDYLVKTNYTWGLHDLGGSSKFVSLDQKRTQFDGSASLYKEEKYWYDITNGNLLTLQTSGTGAETITSHFDYHDYGSAEHQIWRKTNEWIEGSISGKVRETTWTYYDTYPHKGYMHTESRWLEGAATNPTTTYTYNSYGLVDTISNPEGHVTSFQYDQYILYPVMITYPSTASGTHITESVYDYHIGKIKAQKDENGKITSYKYDGFGRLEQVDYPDGGQKIITYSDLDDPSALPRYVHTKIKEDAANYIESREYLDNLGRTIQTTSKGIIGDGISKYIVTRSFYDQMGRKSRTEGPFFVGAIGFVQIPAGTHPYLETTYDYRSRASTVKSADSTIGTIQTSYSYSGFNTTVTDPDGRSKTEKRDYLGRIYEVVEEGGFTTTYDYNVAGDLLAITDHNQNVTSMTYDTLGRKKTLNDSDLGNLSYDYYPDGNLKSQTDNQGQTITFSYDELNRLTNKSYSTSDPTVTYTYDNDTIPNGKGRLSQVTNGSVTTEYLAYDDMGRATSVKKTIAGSPAKTTGYSFDLSGKTTGITYPDGDILFYYYYAGTGLLDYVVDLSGKVHANIEGYEPSGKIKSLKQNYDGGTAKTTTTYAYDIQSTRLTEIRIRDVLYNDIQWRSYGYTAAGDINLINDQLHVSVQATPSSQGVPPMP